MKMNEDFKKIKAQVKECLQQKHKNIDICNVMMI